MEDPVVVAELYLGAPYLWGGNSVFGIDCSGLVQAAFKDCGMLVPGDSDLQALAGTEVQMQDLRRGDLMFWPGHVAILRDARTIIHANAHHMATVIEDLAHALVRIPDPVTTCRRLLPKG